MKSSADFAEERRLVRQKLNLRKSAAFAEKIYASWMNISG
jgi:hypothetical protein